MADDRVPFDKVLTLHDNIFHSDAKTPAEYVARRELWLTTLELSGWTEDQYFDEFVEHVRRFWEEPCP